MKITLTVLFTFLLINISSSQSNWIGLHLNGFTGLDENKYENSKVLGIGFSFNKELEKNAYRELAIVALNFRNDENETISIANQSITTTDGEKRTSLNIRMRYEYGKLFSKNEQNKLVPGIGLSLDPFFIYNRIHPKVSTNFPFKNYRIGTELRLIPRLAYKLMPKMDLSLRIPILLTSLYWEKAKNENPTIPISARTIKNIAVDFDPDNIQLSLGISYKI